MKFWNETLRKADQSFVHILTTNHCGSSIGWCFWDATSKAIQHYRYQTLIDPEEKAFAAVFHRCLGLSSSVDWHNGSMRGSWRCKRHCSSHQQPVLSDNTSFCRIRRNLHPFLVLRLLTHYFISPFLITPNAFNYAGFAQTWNDKIQLCMPGLQCQQSVTCTTQRAWHVWTEVSKSDLFPVNSFWKLAVMPQFVRQQTNAQPHFEWHVHVFPWTTCLSGVADILQFDAIGCAGLWRPPLTLLVGYK